MPLRVHNFDVAYLACVHPFTLNRFVLTCNRYVLHGITDGGKWAYLGDVPDIPDAKKGQ